MYRSFGEALEDFASSIDIADERVLQDIGKMLKKYLLDELGFDFYEVLLERWIPGEEGPKRVLDTRLCKGGESFRHVPVNRGTTNQTAYCFVKDQPLWITSDNEEPLDEATRYIDSWSDAPPGDLPEYKSGNRFRIKTSIIQPLKNGQGAFGVINVESRNLRICNPWAQQELELVAGGVAAIVERVESREASKDGTERSIERLGNFGSGKRWNPIKRPKLFVACSERADGDVVDTIKSYVAKHKDHDVVFWQKHKGRGDIGQLMLERLRESRVIVCYLSEPVDGGKYADNPNVLIEAGIAQGLNCAWDDVGVVVVREEDSVTEIPFDLDGHDVLKVPRTTRGALSKGAFKEQLGERVTLAIKLPE